MLDLHLQTAAKTVPSSRSRSCIWSRTKAPGKLVECDLFRLSTNAIEIGTGNQMVEPFTLQIPVDICKAHSPEPLERVQQCSNQIHKKTMKAVIVFNVLQK
ncbi:uncharacterized protein LOC125767512 [Anopheles funestus]|uniref:uncharacterized protein LOC125767512 n=1 Tax=Anopheles funestus TaxID=62324 RepID=UPI0020C71247|nr:uncharacterized protein LOC125767512 [Anopheles funestus]